MGARGATVNMQLERAGRLDPGTRFTQAKVTDALDVMRQVLAQNGYFEPAITYKADHRIPEEQLDRYCFQRGLGTAGARGHGHGYRGFRA